jgi:hypothetical protein
MNQTLHIPSTWHTPHNKNARCNPQPFSIQHSAFRIRHTFLLLLLLLLPLTRPAFAADLVKGEIVSVGIGGIDGKGGTYRAGAWVPVRVRLENRSGKQLVCRLGVEQIDLDGDKVLSLGEPVILDAADVTPRESWLYYWPRPDDNDLHGIKSVAVLDATGTQVLATLSTLTSLGGGGEAIGIGPIDELNHRSSRFVVVLGPTRAAFSSFDGSYGGTANVVSAWAQQPTDLPDNVLGYDGVDTVVWEADHVPASDLPPDFQLKALLAWVRAGGHLIISVSSQAQEFLKGDSRLREALPMTFTGVRELTLDDLHTLVGAQDLAGSTAPITQVTGTLRADARPVAGTTGPAGSILNKNPLAVTGLYGQGAITVITVDVTNPALAEHISDHDWILFWSQMAGWQVGLGLDSVLTRAEYDDQRTVKKIESPVTLPAVELHIGDDIPSLVDVAEATQVRLLVAVLFLGLYWLIAGPIGHLILRAYKIVHWSWWIFGGTVLVAAGAAGLIVFFLQLTRYDLRHKTILLGTVNSKEVTAISYYGIFAPASGNLTVSQPPPPPASSPAGNEGGLSYLAPMCMPTNESVKPFADPQSYRLSNDDPNAPNPVFRSTLKKMQGRWAGTHDGIDGTATFVGENARGGGGTKNPLAGSLVNHSGYDLHNVEFLVHFAPHSGAQGEGQSYFYRANDWKQGDSLNLATALQVEQKTGVIVPIDLQEVLESLCIKFSQKNGFTEAIGSHGPDKSKDDLTLVDDRPNDLLYLLLDARSPDPLNLPDRIEPIRPFARTTDCTKAFYAAGAMIVARAGDIAKEKYVPSPVPLTVNGREVPGKGEITFAWMLPIQGATVLPPGLPGFTHSLPATTPSSQESP